MARLLLRSMGPEWSQVHQRKLQRQQQPAAGQSVNNVQATQAQISTKDGVTLAILAVAVLVAVRGYLWYQDGELLKASLLGVGTALGLVAAGWGWWRWRQARSRVYDPLQVKEKTSRIAFDGEIQLTAILPEGASPDRAAELLGPVAAAYRHYDNPAGARFRVSKVKPIVPSAHLHPAGAGVVRRAQRAGGEGGRRPMAPAGSQGRDPPGGPRRVKGAPALGPGHQRRRPGGRDHHRPGQEGPLPPGPAAPPPPLRGPHPDGQVHPDAPRRRPQAQGEGSGQRPGRHHRGGPPRRPGGQPPGPGAGEPHRPA